MQFYNDLSQLRSSNIKGDAGALKGSSHLQQKNKDICSSPRRSNILSPSQVKPSSDNQAPSIQADILMVLSGLIIIVGAAMFTINIYTYFFWANEASFSLMIISGLTVLLGLSVMFWTIGVRTKLRGLNGKTLNEKGKIVGAWLLFGCIIIIGLCYTFILSSWLWNNYAFSYGEAKEYHINDSYSLSTFNNLIILQTVLFFSLFFFLGSVTSVLFKISLDDNFMGVVNCGISIFLAFFSMLTLFISIACLRQTEIKALEDKLSKKLIYGCLICSCIAAIFAIIYFLNTFFNRTKFLIAIGYLLFFFVVISACFSGLAFRNAKIARESLTNNCPELLRDTFKEALEEIGCPHKYLNNTSPFDKKECPLEQQTYFWEKDEMKNMSMKTYERACLNFNCCKLAANYNLRWYFRLITSMIGLVFFGILLAGGSLQFSQEASIDGKDTYKIYTVTGFLLLALLLILAIIYIFMNPLTLLKDSAQPITKEDLNYTSDNKMLKYFTADLKSEEKDCSKLKKFLNVELPIKFDEVHCTNNNCSSYLLRVGILVPPTDGQISLNRNVNNESVRVYPAQEAQATFGDYPKQGGALLLEGKPESLKDFIKNEVIFCPKGQSLIKTMNIRLFQHKIEMRKTVTKIKSPIVHNIEADLRPQDLIRLHRGIVEKKSSQALGGVNDNTIYNLYESDFQKFVGGSWGTVELTIQDPETGEKLNGASVLLYKGLRGCLKEERGDFITVGETDREGVFKAYNIHHGNYTFQITKKGFFFNCLSLSLSSDYEVISMHLVKKIEAANTVKILAEWQNYQNLLELNSLFNFNERHECLANTFYQTCGNMKVISDKNLNRNKTPFSSLITITNLAQYKYLIFVNILGNLFKQNSEIDKASLEEHQLALEKSGMAIKLFVTENEYPVLISQPDIAKYVALYQKDQEYKNIEKFFWLSFCIDGKVGPASARSLNQYWTDKALPQDYWFRQNQRGIPHAEICDKVFHTKQ